MVRIQLQVHQTGSTYPEIGAGCPRELGLPELYKSASMKMKH